LLIGLIIQLHSIAEAQVSKGTYLIGGNFSFNYSKGEGNSNLASQKSLQYAILPKIGYFVAENWAIGTRIGFENNKSEYSFSPITEKNSNPTFVFAPFARYYYMLGEKAGVFIQGTVNFEKGNRVNEQTNNSTNVTQTSKQKVSGLEIGLTPGFVFFPSPKFGLETTFGFLGYARRKTKGNDATATSNNFVAYASSLSYLNIGLHYYMSRK